MPKKLNRSWFRAAGIRAIKTSAQTAVAFFTVGAAISDINWIQLMSVSAVAGVASMINSIAVDLPELENVGGLDDL